MFRGGLAIQEKTFLDYWLVLYERKRTILIIVLTAILSAGILSYILPSIYESTTVFFVSEKPDTLTFLSPASSQEIKRTPLMPVHNEEQQAVYIGLLESRDLMRKVSQKTGKSYSSLKKDVDFRINNKYLIELYSRDENPEVAAEVANTYVDVFNDTIDSFASGPTSQKRIMMEKEIKNNERRLKDSENALRMFQEKNNLTSISTEIDNLADRKIDLQTEIEKSHTALSEINTKIAKLEEFLTKEADLYISSSLIDSNLYIRNLRNQLSDTEAAIAALKIDYQDSHPEIRKRRAQYNEIKKEIESEIRKIVMSEGKDPNSFHEKLRQQLITSLVEKQAIEAKIKGLKEEKKNLDVQIVSLPSLGIKTGELEQSVSLYKKTHDNLYLQLEEIKAQEKRKMQNVIIVSSALLPGHPVYPNVPLNIIVAILLGLITGIFYCFFMNYIENVKDPERKWK